MQSKIVVRKSCDQTSGRAQSSRERALQLLQQHQQLLSGGGGGTGVLSNRNCNNNVINSNVGAQSKPHQMLKLRSNTLTINSQTPQAKNQTQSAFNQGIINQVTLSSESNIGEVTRDSDNNRDQRTQSQVTNGEDNRTQRHGSYNPQFIDFYGQDHQKQTDNQRCETANEQDITGITNQQYDRSQESENQAQHISIYKGLRSDSEKIREISQEKNKAMNNKQTEPALFQRTSQFQNQSKTQPLIYSMPQSQQTSDQQIQLLKQKARERELPLSPNRGGPQYLLPPQTLRDQGKKTLVLDLDETLVHSSFDHVDCPDLTLPVELDGRTQYVYVLKRPFCEEFIQRMSHIYEIVMFTASLSQYAEPLYSRLDKSKVTTALLYREHCTFYNGIFVKDMKKLGRPLEDVIIIDNSPFSYLFQPENAMPSISWYEDKNDRELNEFVPILEKLARVKDVRQILPKIVEDDKVNLQKAKEILNIGQLMNPEDDVFPNNQKYQYSPTKALSPQNPQRYSPMKGQSDKKDIKIEEDKGSSSNKIEQISRLEINDEIGRRSSPLKENLKEKTQPRHNAQYQQLPRYLQHSSSTSSTPLKGDLANTTNQSQFTQSTKQSPQSLQPQHLQRSQLQRISSQPLMLNSIQFPQTSLQNNHSSSLVNLSLTTNPVSNLRDSGQTQDRKENQETNKNIYQTQQTQATSQYLTSHSQLQNDNNSSTVTVSKSFLNQHTTNAQQNTQNSSQQDDLQTNKAKDSDTQAPLNTTLSSGRQSLSMSMIQQQNKYLELKQKQVAQIENVQRRLLMTSQSQKQVPSISQVIQPKTLNTLESSSKFKSSMHIMKSSYQPKNLLFNTESSIKDQIQSEKETITKEDESQSQIKFQVTNTESTISSLQEYMQQEYLRMLNNDSKRSNSQKQTIDRNYISEKSKDDLSKSVKTLDVSSTGQKRSASFNNSMRPNNTSELQLSASKKPSLNDQKTQQQKHKQKHLSCKGSLKFLKPSSSQVSLGNDSNKGSILKNSARGASNNPSTTKNQGTAQNSMSKYSSVSALFNFQGTPDKSQIQQQQTPSTLPRASFSSAKISPQTSNMKGSNGKLIGGGEVLNQSSSKKEVYFSKTIQFKGPDINNKKGFAKFIKTIDSNSTINVPQYQSVKQLIPMKDKTSKSNQLNKFISKFETQSQYNNEARASASITQNQSKTTSNTQIGSMDKAQQNNNNNNHRATPYQYTSIYSKLKELNSTSTNKSMSSPIHQSTNSSHIASQLNANQQRNDLSNDKTQEFQIKQATNGDDQISNRLQDQQHKSHPRTSPIQSSSTHHCGNSGSINSLHKNVNFSQSAKTLYGFDRSNQANHHREDQKTEDTNSVLSSNTQHNQQQPRAQSNKNSRASFQIVNNPNIPLQSEHRFSERQSMNKQESSLITKESSNGSLTTIQMLRNAQTNIQARNPSQQSPVSRVL